MVIEVIALENFRNYSRLSIDCNSGINFLLGKNAQGKTNIVESIVMSSIGKSFRSSNDNELIKFGKPACKISIKVKNSITTDYIEINISKEEKKRISVNKKDVKSLKNLLGKVLTISFIPDDLAIVKDVPQKRRTFLDKELCIIYPQYLEYLSKYKRTLQQRNGFLKYYEKNDELLDILDRQLSNYGSNIICYRAEFIKTLNDISRNIHFNITNKKEDLSVKYISQVDPELNKKHIEDVLYLNLKKNKENDIIRKNTSIGPHKDDLEFYINGINVRDFGSQGQQRTTAISIKLAEIEIIKNETKENPILLLDDILSELDSERQEFLIKSFEDLQVFITATEVDDKILSKIENKKIFFVESGKVGYQKMDFRHFYPPTIDI